MIWVPEQPPRDMEQPKELVSNENIKTICNKLLGFFHNQTCQ